MPTHIATALAVAVALPAAALGASNPYTQPDDTWISLSGTAVEAGPDAFTLDYGKGIITVEMGDWGWYEKEGHALIEGDKVTVYGEVDDNLGAGDTIQASSLYVASLGSYFQADSTDEQARRYSFDPTVTAGYTELTGTVTGIDGRRFTIDSGLQQLTIDTTLLDYNPLDDKGYQQVDVDDLVSVAGMMASDLRDGMELLAESIVILNDRKADPSS